jgi:hypothetical protein
MAERLKVCHPLAYGDGVLQDVLLVLREQGP